MEHLIEVRFLPADRVVWVRPGSGLLAAAEAAGVEIVTGCTRGMCGTDPVHIQEGEALLVPPKDHELGTLERMGIAPPYRLGCSAVLADRPDAGAGESANAGEDGRRIVVALDSL